MNGDYKMGDFAAMAGLAPVEPHKPTRPDGEPVIVEVRFDGHLADEIHGIAEAQNGGDCAKMIHDMIEYALTPAESRMNAIKRGDA